ncbi:MAG: zinc ribbon domain-containing protein [Stomatobaculum sp.]|nr:zinc ribbon domain-containing protein [Stomatobaculum sp.]
MYCRYCGAQIPDDSRFCEKCGGQLGAPAAAQGGYMQQRSAPSAQQGYVQNGFPPQTGYQQGYGQQGYGRQASGALLKDAGKMTRYNGKGAIGPVTGTGSLLIYDDRLEYHKTSGDQRGFMLGPIVGNLVMRNGVKKNPVDTYYFQDLAGVTSGKYAGLLQTLVLNLRDGKAVSFVPAGRGVNNGEMIQEIRTLIQRYL